MKKIRKRLSYRFTLVELLVAMAVFSILLLFMMQFFTGSQKIWVSMEEKNNLYADARVSMDLISTLLQGTYFAQGQVPFLIDDIGTENSKIYFPTQSQMDLIEDAGKVIFVSIQRGTTNATSDQLRMAVLSDADKNDTTYDFSLFFPPYVDKYSSARDALMNNTDGVKKLLDKKMTPTDETGDCVTLLDNVTGFRLIPMEKDGAEIKTITGNSFDEIPFMIEIQLSLMSKKNYDFWVNELKGNTGTESTQAKNYRAQHEHTFTRTVYLGDRWNQTF
ncbi:MAG TPA: type II secretion system GspH family protein [Victivallis vadensis]|nr:type II secretion system GspH family protein [Victivallis vadensis]